MDVHNNLENYHKDLSHDNPFIERDTNLTRIDPRLEDIEYLGQAINGEKDKKKDQKMYYNVHNMINNAYHNVEESIRENRQRELESVNKNVIETITQGVDVYKESKEINYKYDYLSKNNLQHLSKLKGELRSAVFGKGIVLKGLY